MINGTLAQARGLTKSGAGVRGLITHFQQKTREVSKELFYGNSFIKRDIYRLHVKIRNVIKPRVLLYRQRRTVIYNQP